MVDVLPFIDGIVESAERIHEESIAKGDYEKAALDFKTALMEY